MNPVNFLVTPIVSGSGLSDLLIAISVPITVAVIGILGLIIARMVRRPVSQVDLWAQINKQNDQITVLQNRLSTIESQRTSDRNQQLNINRVMGDGFDALSGYVRRTTAVGRRPDFTDDERDKIEKARALRDSDELWPTASNLKGASPS